jgi:hypothetical protein
MFRDHVQGARADGTGAAEHAQGAGESGQAARPGKGTDISKSRRFSGSREPSSQRIRSWSSRPRSAPGGALVYVPQSSPCRGTGGRRGPTPSGPGSSDTRRPYWASQGSPPG